MKWIGKHNVFSDLLIGGVLLTPPDNEYSYELTLPNDDGTASQVLSTDGNGVLSWVANGVAVPNALTMGTGFDLSSGAVSWTGSVAETISIDWTEFSSISIGPTDNAMFYIRRSPNSSAAAGGDLELRGGNSGSGTNLAAGDLELHTGLGTGSGTAGLIEFWAGMNTGSGTSGHTGVINSTISSTTTQNTFTINEPGVTNTDTLEFKVAEHGASTITTVDAAAAAANLDFVIDGQFSVASTGIDISGAGVISNATWNGATIGVPYGGTGATSLNDNSVLTGTGASAITAESNLTFDGAKLDVAGGGTSTWIAGVSSSTLNTGYGFFADLNDSLTATHNNIGLYIDYDKSGVTATGQTATLQGVKVDINDAATNHGSGVVLLKGLNACLTSANATGTIRQYGVFSELTGGDEQYGIKQTLTGATVGTTYGLWQKLDDGSNDLRFHSSADEDDYFNIATGAAGITTITTVDDGGTAAHLAFNIDGKITMTPADISGTVFKLDADADSDNVVDIDAGILDVTSSGAAAIIATGTAEIAGSTVTLDSAANIELEVGATSNYVQTTGILRGTNVGPISDTFIPVMPIEFAIGDNYRSPGSMLLNGHAMAPSDDRATYMAQKIIPKGYTASACIVNGTDANANATFICFEGDISGTTPASRSSATAVNSTASFSSNIVGNGEKFCTIIFNPGETADTIKGAKITIAKT